MKILNQMSERTQEHGLVGSSLFCLFVNSQGGTMQQSLQTRYYSQKAFSEEIFVIPCEVFRALYPMEQLMARALERVGKVRIEKDDLTSR